MALNILSTGVMVRLGKVYGNRMVDVAASNSKLVDRSLRILTDLVGLSREQGLPLLEEAKGSVKRALVMAAAGMSLEDAHSLLAIHNGNLRKALDSIGVTLNSTAH
jgi:N-acetylmuramic acid 6-phosphate etherase